MAATSDLQPFLSQKPIVLIVEDRLTKLYLLDAWGPDEQFFNVLVAGGKATVQGLVEDLRRHGHHNVFGLVDRDFGTSNAARWSDRNGPPEILRPDFHEIENVLLDWQALEGCDLNRQRHNRTAVEIEQVALAEAVKQPWWLACRKCLADRQAKLGDGFPRAPRLDAVAGFQPAFDHIAGSSWYQSLTTTTVEITDEPRLEQELRDAHQTYSTDLISGAWSSSYSGKEIYRVLLSRIYDVPGSVSPEPDVDLAKSVARWQRDNSSVPSGIDQIRRVLRQHVGL